MADLRKLLFLMFASLAVMTATAARAATEWACIAPPGGATKCTDVGDMVCEFNITDSNSTTGGGCSGDCAKCAGPGGLPNKICMPVESGSPTCDSNLMSCGAQRPSTCAGGTTSGSCLCQPADLSGKDCGVTNCG